MSVSENVKIMQQIRNAVEENNYNVRSGKAGSVVNTPNVPNLNECNTSQLKRSLALARKAAVQSANAPKSETT